MSFRGTISWKSSQGILLLGISQTTKTLLLKPGGEAVPGPFDLQYKPNYWRSCLIEDPLNGQFILTGGGETDTSRNVVRYGENGFIEHLPKLKYHRYDHSCAGYYNDDGQLAS